MDKAQAQCDLSALAPSPEVDEALSSWLARTAEAHLLTISELQREIGGGLSAFDRGDLTLLPKLALMTRIPSETLSSLVLHGFVAEPARPGPPPPNSWAVCASCLHADQERGGVPYVRRVWTDPLFIYCPIHEVPLVPHGNSPVKVVSDLTLFGKASRDLELRDSTLSRWHFDNAFQISSIHKELELSEGNCRFDSQRTRYAILDIVDALATSMRTDGSGALVSMVEKPMMKRRSLPGSQTIPQSWWSDVAARDRLLYVRIALLFIAQPKSPSIHWVESPFGRSWFARRLCTTENIPWLNGAALDPLILATMELPGEAISQLSFRAARWPPALWQRWTYAVAAAALGRYGRIEKSQPVAGN